MRLTEGLVIDGRYRLTHRIGSGGMADVWCAEDSELGRLVAIKVLHDNFARDREFVERFRREASSAAGLQHPNVVAVFDRGEVEDTYYIAMEYVEGSSLRDLINRGLEIHEAVEVARQVLSAAEFAHARGIVHRDLKPMNVLIDPGGRIRVTDFGIARAGESEITQTGSVMGTAQYLSPEQAQGIDVTAASDVYSIGVILFEMLTGRVPFSGDNAVAIAMKQVGEAPPAPSSINPAVPPALDAVVLRALAKDPVNRFGSAAEMSAALDAAEADPYAAVGHTERYAAVAPPPPTEEDSRRKWMWAALALLALLAAGAAAYLLTRPDTITVPGVTGKSQAQAELILDRAGFDSDVDPVTSNVPEGDVIEQDPRGGIEVERGSLVVLTVSLGPGSVKVPVVAGKPKARAEQLLKKAGFDVKKETRPSREVKAGRTIGTVPAAGTELEPGQTVTLLISQGPETATVPSVVGINRLDAAAMLRDAGFIPNADPENSDLPEDQVIRQIPAAGTTLETGREVTIVYSTGAGSIVLDDYVGQKQSFAERKLQNAGLETSVRYQTVTDESDDGIVLDQSPPAGTRLSQGDRVSLVVGRFIAPPPDTTSTTTTP